MYSLLCYTVKHLQPAPSGLPANNVHRGFEIKSNSYFQISMTSSELESSVDRSTLDVSVKLPKKDKKSLIFERLDY